MTYQHTERYASENLHASPYNFTKDFDGIARPGLVRYLEHFGCAVEPEEGEDPADFDLMDSSDEAREYLGGLRQALKDPQENLVEFDMPPTCYPGITTWSREGAVAFTESRLDDMLGATADGPVDIYRAVHLGSEMARKQGLDVGPEASAYAADRLKSKIERDAVCNPVTEVHAGILAHRFLKEWQGGKVVYLDPHKRRRERAERAQHEQPKQERPKQDEPKSDKAESRFKFTAIGDIPDDDEAVEWAVRGLLAKNTVSLFFGKPSGGKGVAASSLAICIAAGLPFLGMEVAQAPTVYFAAERRWQVRRRIKGLMRKHELPADTPCFIGGGPLDIRKESDAKELICEVRAIEQRTGAPVGFIVIDTFSREGKRHCGHGRCRQKR